MSNQQLQVFSKPGDLTAFLKTGESAIKAALPKHLNPDRMVRLAVTAFSTNPGLRKCTGVSILSSLIVASQLGLEPGIAGQGYLIPYGNTCTFVAGWQGIVGLLNNTGRATAWTGCVYEGDEFEFQLGSRPVLNHRPGENYGDPEKMTWVYACGKVNGSEQPVVEAWPIARVWKHRDRFNKVGRQHYSFAHPEMYARKVVLLQVLKYMPRSIELQNALTAANAAEVGNFSRVEDGGIVIEVESEAPETPAGKVGSTPIEDAAKPAKATEKPKAEPKKEEPVQGEPVLPPAHAYKPRQEPTEPAVEQEPSAEELAQAQPVQTAAKGPSKDELVTAVTRGLTELNIGKLAYVRTLVAEGILEAPCSFADVPANALQASLDDWQAFAEKMKPKE